MRLLSTLMGRIFLASALVAVVSIAVAVRFATVRVSREAEDELRRGLLEAASLVEQHHAARLETLTVTARLIADLPKLKAAVATGDPPTVEPVALDYGIRVKSDFFAVTGRDARVLAAQGAAEAVSGLGPAVREALSGRESASSRPAGDALLEIVTVPIAIETEPPEILGTLSIGLALDDALAARVKAVTASEVAFALDGRVRGSTLEDPGGALAGLLAGDGIATTTLDGNEFVAVRRTLPGRGPGGPAPVALILRSRTERLAFLRTLRTAFLVASGVVVAIAILLSYAVARTVTRPLADVTEAMRQMAATGDLTRKIRLRRGWNDEDGVLLATTFNTLTESIARFQKEAALRERLSALGRLSTVIAHEVRNPLMIIKAALRTLRRGGATVEEVGEVATDIDHEVGRLDRVVEDVLDFARPVRLEYAPVDLNALCREAAAALGSEAAPGLRLDLDPSLRPVVTDGERLRTALVNVLTNAREALGPEPPAPAFTLRTSRVGEDRVAIEVEDRGSGIDAEGLPHVFDPYFTTKRTGTGLGLAIAKNLVEAMGGAIAMRSRPGEGTTVRIELPRERVA